MRKFVALVLGVALAALIVLSSCGGGGGGTSAPGGGAPPSIPPDPGKEYPYPIALPELISKGRVERDVWLPIGRFTEGNKSGNKLIVALTGQYGNEISCMVSTRYRLSNGGDIWAFLPVGCGWLVDSSPQIYGNVNNPQSAYMIAESRTGLTVADYPVNCQINLDFNRNGAQEQNSDGSWKCFSFRLQMPSSDPSGIKLVLLSQGK